MRVSVPAKQRIAVVSPFLDRRHGTERCILEQIERLAREPDWEVHLYAQRVEDLETARFGEGPASAARPGAVVWHRVSSIPGPHLLRFGWWYCANRFARWRDAKFRRLRFDVVYSPGINCADADAICVHACFSALEERSRNAPAAGDSGIRPLARRLHRKLYYSLLSRLERRLYSQRSIALAAVSRRTASELERLFGRSDVRVIPNAVDHEAFHPAARVARRSEARKQFGYREEDFVALLISNDWRMKGLPTLLEAVAQCGELPVRLLVVGQDDPDPYVLPANPLGIRDRLQFAPPSADVLGFYAAADAYASPTLEDSFGLPALEAMACGLPVITSVESGVAEVITGSVDGFVLCDPLDSLELARLITLLYEQPDLRRGIGERASRTAHQYTWDRNASETMKFLKDASLAKRKPIPS